MQPQVEAAVIVAAVTLSGFIIQGMLISRWIDKKRLEDTKKIEELKGKLSSRQRSQDSRRESLEVLFNATSIAKSAARELLNVSASQNSEERIHRAADSLQKMSQFFEKTSEAERNLHLISEDVLQVRSVQAELVKIFLLLDLDLDTPEYRDRLQRAYEEFATRFEEFKSYIRSATAES